MTAILHVEHRVSDYDRWKETFDRDPIGRKQSGVRSYRILRATAESNLVMIDLELGTREEAEAMLAALLELWGPISGVLIHGPTGRIFDVVEVAEL